LQNTNENYISVIGTSFLDPIVKLMETLDSIYSKHPNRVHASPLENGYSAAIITLTVLLVESALNRTRYIFGWDSPTKPLKFFKKAFPSSILYSKLKELFVIRDVIVHNHIWEMKYRLEEEGMKFISAKLLNSYGNKKFKKIINSKTRKTKLLKMNLLPTEVCRKDVVIVLKSAYEILSFLENKDRKYIYISIQPVKFKGKNMEFSKFIRNL